jgi:hypothetical protein
MFGLLTRLWKVLWRQDMEGAGPNGTLVSLPESLFLPSGAETIGQAPIEFLRRSGDVAAPVQTTTPSNRNLAAQLQCVARLNTVSSRKPPKNSAAQTAKPKPLAQAPAVKRIPAPAPGVVLNRISRTAARGSAVVVDLATVRRAKQVDTSDMEIAALFH